MAANLRQLLLQRSARLQSRPAITAPGWGTLSWSAWRNRVEGVAFGLLSVHPEASSIAPGGPAPWGWTLEVAAACSGIRLDGNAPAPDPENFGGSRFNAQEGRQAYHDREDELDEGTPFDARLTHGEMMLKLQRWNRKLGWDHTTSLPLLLAEQDTDEGRALLWNLVYAGGHAVLVDAHPPTPRGLARLFTRPPSRPAQGLADVRGFWD